MLKTVIPVKSLERDAAAALRSLLAQVPALELVNIESERGSDRGPDLVAHVKASDRRHTLLCEVKASGQPRHVRVSALELRSYAARSAKPATPMLIAPYLSPEAQALCRDEAIGFLDFEGNARLQFDSVFIERVVASKPPAERRELKSLFKAKSARVLRAMLRDPTRAWRVSDLALHAGVSLGHVSNVRASLLDREWARVTDDGLLLTNPAVVLDGWSAGYEPPAGERMAFYTALHGAAFDEAARKVLRPQRESIHAAFASFSAARWLAPYARVGAHDFYADDIGLDAISSALALSPVTKGENVVVTVLRDAGPLHDAVEQAPGVVCTSPVQTYLDLYASGERGREAAEHLRREMLAWPS